ncbi:MAG: anthranilate phosphoribosyltransferase [Fimbriimonadaceae bacterium]|nr:anthranilate phosphoribosyltransferase [Fimbriimonadaceae bacterium]
MEFRDALERVVTGGHLDARQSSELMRFLVGGDAGPAQIGAILAALRAKGCTGEELAGFAQVLRENATPVDAPRERLVDTCGTGGGRPTFNLSTASAIVASAAGARVAKHGNRAVTSLCGSADVLEAAGVRLEIEPARATELLGNLDLAFLFAPALHPTMRLVGPARRELGVRTVFNQLGPLANPAGAPRQVIGVYDETLLEPMADALVLLGAERALVVWAEEGMDEVSPCGPTRWEGVADGERTSGRWSPDSFGLDPLPPAALAPGETLERSAAILWEAISDPDSARCAALLPGAAATLWCAGVVPDLREGVALALQAVASGAARARLASYAEASHQP